MKANPGDKSSRSNACHANFNRDRDITDIGLRCGLLTIRGTDRERKADMALNEYIIERDIPEVESF